MTIRIDFSYDGRNFHGSQRQKHQRTVQGEMEAALRKLYHEPITLHLSGRTDSGVHALRQVAHFKAKPVIPLESALFALSNLMPPDIMLLQLDQVDDDFHARYSAKQKTYLYVISYRDDVFQRPYQTYLDRPLNLSQIDRAIDQLVGKHDFYSFSNRRKGERTTVRTLYEISYQQTGDQLEFRFRADGYLYKMVRILMQFLIEIGWQKIDPDKTSQILQSHSRELTRKVAPPQGLYLEEIMY